MLMNPVYHLTSIAEPRKPQAIAGLRPLSIPLCSKPNPEQNRP